MITAGTEGTGAPDNNGMAKYHNIVRAAEEERDCELSRYTSGCGGCGVHPWTRHWVFER